MAPEPNVAVLEERVDQTTRRIDADIAELKTAITQLSKVVTQLAAQISAWRGGLGLLVAMLGAVGAGGTAVGWMLGKGGH